MALAQDIANKSIREAISTIASAVDALSPQDLSALTQAVEALKSEVKALNVAINGEPAPSGVVEAPAPTTPV